MNARASWQKSGGNWLKGSNSLSRRTYISQSTYLKVAELLHNYYNAVWSLYPGEKKIYYILLCV